MLRQRNYKAEYQRRLERAFREGLSRSQARGHAKADERPIRAPPQNQERDLRLESALKTLRRQGNQSAAAKEAGISVERFRRFLKQEALATRQGRTWTFTDSRIREISVITTRGFKNLEVRGFDTASLVGRHNAAIGQFLNSNDTSLLQPFKGLSFKGSSGRTHILETNPNAIHRLANSGNEVFEMVYRLTP